MRESFPAGLRYFQYHMTDKSRTLKNPPLPPYMVYLKIDPRTQTLITKARVYKLNRLRSLDRPRCYHEHPAFRHT